MKIKKMTALLLCLILALGMFSACGKKDADAKSGGTLLIGMAAEPITLNPNGKVDSNMGIIAPLLFSKLMTVTATGKTVCDLAESYELSGDHLSYTFHLPANVKFSDGQPLTSADVKFSFEEVVKQSGQAADALLAIKTIECPDAQTVVITLNEPSASFLGSLAYDGVYILPKHVYEGKDWLGADGMQTPVGSGPFKFNKWDSGISLSVVKNENYYKGPDLPYLDGITFSFIADVDTALQAFQNGELDIMGVIPSDAAIKTLMVDSRYNCYYTMYASRFFIGFNLDEEPFNDINFRMAVAQALDIDDLITKAMSTCCQKAGGYFSPLFDFANDPNVKLPAFNLDEAKASMEKTGLTKGSDGFYCHVTMETYNYEPFPSMSQVIKSQLAEIGIDVTINMMEYGAWDENVRQNRDFQMTVIGTYVGPDVAGFAPFITTGGAWNLADYSNARIDELMAEASTKITDEERAPYYQEVCQILNTDLPMVMIGEWGAYTPIPSYVHNHPLSGEMKDSVGTSDFSQTYTDNK